VKEMAKVFDARRAIYVPACSLHPKNTEYRVAWGIENWTQTPVTKVQMVYNGKVAGMLSPSYPDNTLDERTVGLALKLLKKGYGTRSKTSKMVLCIKEVKDANKIDSVIEEVENEIENMNREIFTPPNVALSPVIRTELCERIPLEDSLYGFLFRVDVG
jgi:hypothetical protein